jgi:sulfate permease, SulP family
LLTGELSVKRLFSELTADATSPKLVSALAIGLVIGVLVVVVEVSFAAMIFSGPLASLATRGAGLTLFGALVMCAYLTLSSSFRSTIGIPQDVPLAVLASLGAAVMAALGQVPPEAAFMTMVAILGLSTLFTGVSFALIGQFGLSNFFRFIPYPVVGGFLAGSGWLLTKGGISVMSPISPGLETLPQLFSESALWSWGPGVAYAVLLFMVMRRWSHFLILPGSIVLFTGIYYVAFQILGLSILEAKEAGILLSGVPTGGLWPAFTPAELGDVRWDLVLSQLPGIATVMLVTLICLLLNLSGLELGSGHNVDLNREFRDAGIANLLGGLGGSSPGGQTLSLSLMCYVTGAYTRLTGLIAAVVTGGVLFLGGGVLEYFPLPMLGGLLVFLGITFMHDWLVASRRKLPWADFAILVCIFLVIGFSGFLEGVAVGLVATVILFVVRFSRVDVIRNRFSVATRSSRKKRPIPHRTILQTEGERMQGYELGGYIFFGSASPLGERLHKGLEATPPPWCVLLDFTDVSGFDVSAVNAFRQFIATAHSHDIPTVLTSAPKRFLDMLSPTLSQQEREAMVIAKDMDHGLEVCEDIVIARQEEVLTGQDQSRDTLFAQSVDDMMVHLDRQAAFEALTEQLAPWLRDRTFEPGDILVAKGEEPAGLQLLVSGAATAQDPDSGVRFANLGPGDILAPQAAFGSHAAMEHIVADGPCRTMELTPEARTLLEQEAPSLALELDRYLISTFTTTT